MLKLEENPPQRFPLGRSLAEDVGRWWVAYTKPRNEKALAWDLKNLNISYYLPQTTKRTRRRDNGKVRKSVICLFSNYIALTDYPRIKQEVWRTKRVARIIPVENQQAFVADLERIRLVLGEEIDLEIHNDLAVGQKVMVIDGPCAGLEGIITDLVNKNRIFLNVSMFARSVSMQVDPAMIMPKDT